MTFALIYAAGYLYVAYRIACHAATEFGDGRENVLFAGLLGLSMGLVWPLVVLSAGLGSLAARSIPPPKPIYIERPPSRADDPCGWWKWASRNLNFTNAQMEAWSAHLDSCDTC